MSRHALACALVALLTTVVAGGASGRGDAGALRADATIFVGRAAVPLSPARQASVTWCGSGPSPADRTPGVELSSPYQVHVVYATPSDGADQFAATASGIASDAEAIDGWWQRQDPARTLRFDLFAFPGCASKLGNLDIGFVRLPHDGAYYGSDDRGTKLISDLAGFAALAQQKILVYYDGPVPATLAQVCGTAYVVRSLSPSEGGAYGFVFVWLGSACPDDLGQGKFTAAVAAHELIHSLGALSQPGAPNECTDPSLAGHVCDSASDILYPYATVNTTLDAVTLDVSRDDYYGHSGSWFDVQDSRWLVHLPQFALSLSATSARGGSGTIEMTAPVDDVCAQACTSSLDNGTVVQLAARPGPRSRLLAWGGACAGAGDCSVTMDGAKTVTAVFGPSGFKLTVAVAGKGKVVSRPAGISCPGRCSWTFEANRAVRLRATPARGFRFAGWRGACLGQAPCFVQIDRDRSARATFRRKR